MKPRPNKHGWSQALFLVQCEAERSFCITVCGRDRWALQHLVQSGERGCTPIDEPAPRWSGYVHNLRQMGVVIETIHEKHDGPFSGTHARYMLRSTVTPTSNDAVAA